MIPADLIALLVADADAQIMAGRDAAFSLGWLMGKLDALIATAEDDDTEDDTPPHGTLRPFTHPTFGNLS